MAKKDYVIVVLGLGDHKKQAEEVLPKYWRLFGLRSEIFKIGWASKDPFSHSLDRLLTRIDQLKMQGYQVSLVGISAGGCAAANAYVLRKSSIKKVVFICVRLGQLDTIDPIYFQRNPAFGQAVKQLIGSLAQFNDSDKAKMLSLQPFYDQLVPPSSTKIPGVKNKRVFAVRHIPSIIVSVVFYAFSIARFIKTD